MKNSQMIILLQWILFCALLACKISNPVCVYWCYVFAPLWVPFAGLVVCILIRRIVKEVCYV